MTLLNRNPGYVAHWREAMGEWNTTVFVAPIVILLLIWVSCENVADPKPRMWRPLQIYVGNIPPQKQDDELKKTPVASSSL